MLLLILLGGLLWTRSIPKDDRGGTEHSYQAITGSCSAVDGSWRAGYSGNIATRVGGSLGELFATRTENRGLSNEHAEAIIASVEALHKCVTSMSPGGSPKAVGIAACEAKHEEEIRRFDVSVRPAPRLTSEAPIATAGVRQCG